jgi:hypothetical protein
MASVQGDAIGGFNTFLEGQKKVEGEADVTLVLFDDQYEVAYEGKDLKDAPKLTHDTFVPRGMTALLDALGKTINSTGERLLKVEEKERPEKVIFAILTDGLENCSREFKKSQIDEMISHQKEKYGWEFVFLAANQDAIETGISLGVSAKDCFTYKGDSKGTKRAFATMNASVQTYRSQ